MDPSGLLSVIIPARNEELQLPRCLEALTREVMAFEFIREIIVVDNGSRDRTCEIAASYSAIVLHSDGTIAEVRNVGASFASGEFLCFLDADVEVCRGWSQAILEYVKREGEFAENQIFGNLVGIPEHCSWVEKTWHFYMMNKSNPTYINSGNMIVHRNLFRRLKGFRVEMMTAEDVDLCQRASNIGAFVRQHPEIRTIHHGNPKNLWRFAVREFWHGLSAIQGLVKGNPKKIDLLALAVFASYPFLVVAAKKFGLYVGVTFFLLLFSLMMLYGIVRTKEVLTTRAIKLGFLLTIFVIARSFSIPGSLFRSQLRMGGGKRE